MIVACVIICLCVCIVYFSLASCLVFFSFFSLLSASFLLLCLLSFPFLPGMVISLSLCSTRLNHGDVRISLADKVARFGQVGWTDCMSMSTACPIEAIPLLAELSPALLHSLDSKPQSASSLPEEDDMCNGGRKL